MPLLRIGRVEFIETLTKKISQRNGFDDHLAQGLVKGADFIEKGSKEFLEGQILKADEKMPYEPRAYITTAFLYAMDTRRSIHLIHQISEPLGQRLLGKEVFNA